MMAQTQYVLDLASKGQRLDERGFNDFRKISIEKNPIEKPEGCARVVMGKTDVIVGVKMEVGEPFPDKQDEGTLVVNAELSPMAYWEFETGPPREGAIELARVVDRGIRESGAINVKKLCIKEKEKVWIAMIDIQVMNHDGNLFDACALAAIEALLGAKFPAYDGEKIDYEKKTDPLPIENRPISVTFVKVGDKMMVDPLLFEEDASSARLTVNTMDNGNICALQKGGQGSFSLEEIEKAFELAIEKGKELRKLL